MIPDSVPHVVRGPTTPQELFDDMLYSALDWPLKTTRLQRDSVQDVRQRSASPYPALAEMYHENSKLHPGRTSELAATRLDVDGVRRVFLERRSSAVPTAAAGTPGLVRARPLLSAVARSAPEALFYALELRVADEKLIARYDPLTDALAPMKAVTPAGFASVSRALTLLEPATTTPSLLLFVVAAFPRNEVLYGVRGYRRTLIEAGALVEIVRAGAPALQFSVSPFLEFHDRVVDGFVEVDGVEQGTVAVLDLRPKS